MKGSIEQLAFSIKKNENIKFDEDNFNEIKFVLKRFFTNARAGSLYINCMFYKILKNLLNNITIKINKFDKDKGTAILDLLE